MSEYAATLIFENSACTVRNDNRLVLVNAVTHLIGHIVSHFEDESFLAIGCTATGNQTQRPRKYAQKALAADPILNGVHTTIHVRRTRTPSGGTYMFAVACKPHMHVVFSMF